ncbi:Abi family protein [Auritidibacter ignavus]|uniref:Abi family protein n=1 Tax=Auritidibacter ignavus TaxID=678932 RepID=UPI0024B98B32|nr:Abi family protein [Auritidibacter ignavus]WHS27183.1 Abi family protein [Auritidibacter ignavus]
MYFTGKKESPTSNLPASIISGAIQFVGHHRDEVKQGTRYLPEAYERMPIWVAVEAMSFGSLSRLIEASGESGVSDAIADSVSGSRRYLPGQVRSFVYLRNRIARSARLWNHSVLDVPGLQPKKVRQVKKSYRQFSDSSIYKVLVALDEVADRSEIRSGWLKNAVEPILNRNDILTFGIATPAKYGEMPRSVLVPSQ